MICIIMTTLNLSRTLQSKYHIPKKECNTYLEIASLLQHNPGRLHQIPRIIAKYLISSKPSKGSISLIYGTLHDKNCFFKCKPFLAWERDLGQAFNLCQWEQAISSTYKSTKSAILWELMHKMTLLWYLTPSEFSQFQPHNLISVGESVDKWVHFTTLYGHVHNE